MIKEILLPCYFGFAGDISLLVSNYFRQILVWGRRKYRMPVVWHQKHKL